MSAVAVDALSVMDGESNSGEESESVHSQEQPTLDAEEKQIFSASESSDALPETFTQIETTIPPTSNVNRPGFPCSCVESTGNRNLVVCIDGTANQFGVNVSVSYDFSNVVKESSQHHIETFVEQANEISGRVIVKSNQKIFTLTPRNFTANFLNLVYLLNLFPNLA